jgi:hypothetical protein
MAAGLRVACALLWLTLPASRYRSSGSLNWLAASAMCAALVWCLLLALSMGATWGSVTTTVLLVKAVLMGAAWVMIELRSAAPLIDMRIMRLPAV